MEITNETFKFILDKVDALEKSMSEKIDALSALHYLIGLFSGTNKGYVWNKDLEH